MRDAVVRYTNDDVSAFLFLSVTAVHTRDDVQVIAKFAMLLTDLPLLQGREW